MSDKSYLFGPGSDGVVGKLGSGIRRAGSSDRLLGRRRVVTTPIPSLTRDECYDRRIRASNVDSELSGGFWAGAVPQCACLGDMNSDGNRNGADIAAFVGCVIQGGACVCADVNGMNGVTLDDVTVFVTDLLMGTACP